MKTTVKSLRALMLSLHNRHFLAVDLFILISTPTLSLFFRLESVEGMNWYASSLVLYTLAFMVLKPLLFWLTGLYGRYYWPYASVDAMQALTRTGLATFVLEVGIFFGVLLPFDLLPVPLPRSLPVINSVMTILFVGTIRLAVRMLFEFTQRKEERHVPMRPVVIAGAGVAGALVVKELKINQQVGLQPVAFLDDDPRKQGARIHDIPVAGRLRDLASVVRYYRALEVIIAMPTAPGKVVRDVLQKCRAVGVTGRTIPGIFELLSGTAKVSQVREIQIEDLLRRGIVRSDPTEVTDLIHGQRVLVTGAGGSIGGELCRQIALFGPAELVLLGHGENSIFKVAKELKGRLPNSKVHPVIGDIRDKHRMQAVFHTYQPEVIFHAAAHKHVGLMETNVSEAITNNVLGTRTLVALAAHHGVERFVMISSDKAVNPTSAMGVTKRIAELIVHDAAVTSGKPFVSVRFGNVLGSRGSVIPIFKEQIALGGPVTVSHPEVTRYFMTIPEAVHLVLQAGALGTGGEVFVLDMGEPIRILDLAKDVIRLSGYVEGRDLDIVFTGLKPGEKMHEELFLASEQPVRSKHEKIFVCPNGMRATSSPAAYADGSRALAGSPGQEGDVALYRGIQALLEAVQSKSTQRIHELFQRIVPEYQPTSGGLPQSPVGDSEQGLEVGREN